MIDLVAIAYPDLAIEGRIIRTSLDNAQEERLAEVLAAAGSR